MSTIPINSVLTQAENNNYSNYEVNTNNNELTFLNGY